MSTQQQPVLVPHPFQSDELVEGQRAGERSRTDSPFSYVAVEIPGAGTWAVPEEDVHD